MSTPCRQCLHLNEKDWTKDERWACNYLRTLWRWVFDQLMQSMHHHMLIAMGTSQKVDITLDQMYWMGELGLGLKGIEKLPYRQTIYGVYISSCSWAQRGQDTSSLNIGHIIRINVKKW